MKVFATAALVAILAGCLSSCSAPDDSHRRALRREREEAKWESERRQRDRQRDADDFRFFLEDYAQRQGKSVSELTPKEKAEAKREFDEEGGRRYRAYSDPHFWR